MAGHSLNDLDGHDPYRLLGLEPTATRAEIVAAHRKQVQLVHPDRPGGDEYETVLLHIAKAVLLDRELRARFDELSNPAPPPAAPVEPAPRSAWDDDGVVTGIHPPAPDPPPAVPPHWPPTAQPYHYETQPQPYWQYHEPPQQYYEPGPQYHYEPAQHYYDPPPPPYRNPQPVHPGGRVSPITVTGLMLTITFCLAPIGLLVSIARARRPASRTDRDVALIAIGINVVYGLLWILSLIT